MQHRIAALLTAFVVALPAAAEYRESAEILDAMLQAERNRAEGISDYAVDITLMGHPTTQYFERAPMETDGSPSFGLFRLVPLDEVQQRLGGDTGISTVGLPALARGFGNVPSGMSAGLMQQTGDIDRAMIARRARIVGREALDGKDAYLVKADDVNLTQVAEGSEFVIRTITLWVAAEDLTTLKMRMDGVVKQDGQTREMFLEKLEQDFREVPGSKMILPYRSVLRMGGMLGPEEEKEMEEARTQLAELDRQMASMPADQRNMMQSMMAPQLETMRRMVEGGTFEVETVVREIRINQGIAGAFAGAARSGAVTPAAIAGSGSVPTGAAQPEPDPQTLRQAREACLQDKVTEAEASKKKKKGFGNFLGAVGRIAGRHGGSGLAADVSRVSGEIYDANATAQDLEEAAQALGISQDDIAACENPEGAG